MNPDILSRFDEFAYFCTAGPYQGQSFRYRLLKPRSIEAGERYPLVLYLHGAGERGTDNVQQLKYLPEWLAGDELRRKYPCFVLAPQCRLGCWWSDGRRIDEEKRFVRTGALSQQLKIVLAILDETLRTYPVDPRRVYLTGLSMGGYGAWDLAVRFPQLFAALAVICAGGETELAAAVVDLPVWAFHGALDDVVPVEESRRMIEAIRSAGGQPKYTELPQVGHDSWTPAYNESGVIAWLFEQLKPPIDAPKSRTDGH